MLDSRKKFVVAVSVSAILVMVAGGAFFMSNNKKPEEPAVSSSISVESEASSYGITDEQAGSLQVSDNGVVANVAGNKETVLSDDEKAYFESSGPAASSSAASSSAASSSSEPSNAALIKELQDKGMHILSASEFQERMDNQDWNK